MPRVRILAGTAGTDLRPGEVRDVSALEAEQLLAEGRAELVRGERLYETPEGSVSTVRTRHRPRQ